VGGGGDPVALFGDQGYPLGHPGIFDELAGMPLQRGQYGADRHAHAGHNSGGVGIHQKPGARVVSYQGTCRLIHFNAGPTTGRSCHPRDMTWLRTDSAAPLSRLRTADAW